MLLRQLEYVTALAREEHFGRAAEACHVSQPALSAGIRKLERELGVQIVQRGQRFEGFTPEGLEVLRWGQRILAEREELAHTLAELRGSLSGTLRIGAIPTALTISTLLTAPLHARHPHVGFTLEALSSRQIVDRVNDYDIDVGMTYVDGEPLGRVRVVPLYREKYFFLTPEDPRWDGRRSVSWAEAAALPLALLMPFMQNRRILDGHFADAGVAPRPVVESDTISAIYAHVDAMGLSSVIPHAWLHGFRVPENARVLHLPQPHRDVHVGLVLPGHGPTSLLARALVDLATQTNLPRLLDRALRQRGPR